MRAPELLHTQRLALRRPRAVDAAAIFTRYAADAEVTRYLAWPRYRTEDDAHAFIAWADAEWERNGIGPYLIEVRTTARLIGGTGLTLAGPRVAETGYVLATDAWGRGFATEALRAMVALGAELDLDALTACVHPDNNASIGVLEKVGFTRTAATFSHMLPNLGTMNPVPVWHYTIAINDAGETSDNPSDGIAAPVRTRR